MDQVRSAKRLIATPDKANTGVKTSNTQNELVGMINAPMAKPTDGISHSFIRTRAEEAYHVNASKAISAAKGVQCSLQSEHIRWIQISMRSKKLVLKLELDRRGQALAESISPAKLRELPKAAITASYSILKSVFH